MAFDTKSPEVHAAIVRAASNIEAQLFAAEARGHDEVEAAVQNRRARAVASLALQIYCHLTDENMLADAVSSTALSRVKDVDLEGL